MVHQSLEVSQVVVSLAVSPGLMYEPLWSWSWPGQSEALGCSTYMGGAQVTLRSCEMQLKWGEHRLLFEHAGWGSYCSVGDSGKIFLRNEF